MGLWEKLKNLVTKGKWEEPTQIPTDQLVGETTIQAPQPDEIDTLIDTGETPIQDPQKTLPEPKKEEETPKTQAEIEQENIDKSLKDKPKVSDINKQIQSSGVTTTERQITFPQNLAEYRPIYQQLLQPKVQDQDLIDAIIAGREHIRHRFTTELHLEINEGQDKTTVTIPGLLPEQINTIYYMIQRLQEPWDQDYFTEYLSRKLEEIRAYNGGQTSTFTPIDVKSGRVTNITHNHTFA